MHARALLLVLGAIAATPAHGWAQPASVRAQALFDDGRRLLGSGKIAEACAAFDASQKLDPLVTTQLNVAACREQNGQLATASAAYAEAERMARAAGDAQLEKVASGHAQRLEPRLSRLIISVPPDRRIAGLQVLRGNDPVAPASWDHPVPVDGGSYTITARAPGREPWSTTRTIKGEREIATIAIPRLAELRPAPPPVVAGAPAEPGVGASRRGAIAARNPSDGPVEDRELPAPPPPLPSRSELVSESGAEPPVGAEPGDRSAPGTPGTPGTPDAGGPSYVAPIALGAVALALGVVGLGFELKSETVYDNARTANDQGNRPAADSFRDSAIRDRYIAQGFAVAAIGSAGVAVYLFVRSRGEHRPSAAVTPVASTGLTGIALTGRW